MDPTESAGLINGFFIQKVGSKGEGEVASMTQAREAMLATPGNVLVNAAGTDLDRGASLVAAYASAKLLTPNGSALSAINRVALILPPGGYKVTSKFSLDTNFIDIAAQIPSDGGLPPDVDYDDFAQAPNYEPPLTHIYTDGDFTAVEQLCTDLRLSGFGIANIAAVTSAGSHGFAIGNSSPISNAPSRYDRMYFAHSSVDFSTLSVTYTGGRSAVIAKSVLSGTWTNCRAGLNAWRCSGDFTAKMFDCWGAPHSFVGDASSNGFVGAHLERCRVVGHISGASYAFGGCSDIASPIDANSVFIECISDGGMSFGLSNTCAGRFYRCRSGEQSFGSGRDNTFGGGGFTGYAEDCVAGKNSFGGGVYAKNTGELLRCTITGNVVPMRVEGAEIRNSRITNVTTGQHGVTLLDSASVISGTDIIVFQGGTGVPIYAATALNVAAYANRMNNASNDADGLHANVTNLVSSAGNVVSNSIA